MKPARTNAAVMAKSRAPLVIGRTRKVVMDRRIHSAAFRYYYEHKPWGSVFVAVTVPRVRWLERGL
jgi:hypothetical protein